MINCDLNQLTRKKNSNQKFLQNHFDTCNKKSHLSFLSHLGQPNRNDIQITAHIYITTTDIKIGFSGSGG